MPREQLGRHLHIRGGHVWRKFQRVHCACSAQLYRGAGVHFWRHMLAMRSRLFMRRRIPACGGMYNGAVCVGGRAGVRGHDVRCWQRRCGQGNWATRRGERDRRVHAVCAWAVERGWRNFVCTCLNGVRVGLEDG